MRTLLSEPTTKPAPTKDPVTTPKKPPRKDPFKPGIQVNPKPKA